MRELRYKDNLIPIRGGVVCRLFYFQEFKEEIEESILKLAKGRFGLIEERFLERGALREDILRLIDGDVSVYERLALGVSELEGIIAESDITETALKVIWAMNKAERLAMGLSTPAYTQWVKNYGGFDIYAVIGDLNAEIYEAFNVTKIGGKRHCGKIENISAASIAVGKKLGFGLRELNEMSVQSFLDIVAAYAGDGKDGGESDGGAAVREASQGDIDWLLG